ncbi:putative cytosine-specific methyltransferase [Burkholderia oklahomensis]|uniref:Cytosine-specific methyltransferase n=1 Tax=Burkholderia oklahomensis TaxID=342113 RepID=A0AAI8FNT8_9BURK|nr:putative cytosine-specific methyltransferase [Burkholderia oklahomensis]
MVWLFIPSSFVLASACSGKASGPHSSILESDIEPFATWSAKPLLPRNLSRLWKREPLIRRLSGLTYSLSMAQRGADEWIASLPDSRAKTYPLPDVVPVSTEGAQVSFSASSISPTLAVRGSSFWRTSQESLLPPPPLWTKRKASSLSARPPASWENWPTAAGMRSGCIYVRPMLAGAISVSAGSASHGGWATPDCNTSSYSNGEFGQNIRQQAMTWATPDANAMERTNRSSSPNAAERPTLALAARAWPTSRGTDGTKGGPNQRDSSGDPMLPSMAAQWSTPNVPSGGRSVSAEVVATRGKTANGKRQVGLESETRHWATPRASMATNGSDSGSASRQVQGANPGLKDQVSQWATPTSSENSNRTTKSAPSHGNGHGMVLAGQAADFSTSLRPVQSMIDGRELSPTDRTLRRRLNPAFACWLMGWPTWWTNPGITNSVRSEMVSYRSKLRSQLSLLLGEPGFSNR